MRRLLRTLGVSLSALAAVAFSATSCTEIAATSSAPLTALENPVIAASHLPSVRISELHYDNVSTDADERVEVSGPAGTDLTGWSLVFYNGSTPSSAVTYRTTTLSGTIASSCGARGVVVVALPVDGIQNGGNDGVALVNGTTVIELLSYEGTLTASNGPAAGMTSTDIGVVQGGTTPANSSLQREGSGTWVVSSGSNTFGSCNDDEDDVPPVVVDHITIAPTSATVAEGSTQQFTATAFDDDNQPLSGVSFSWTSSAQGVATVNASGLATGVTAGETEIRAAAGEAIATATLQVTEAPIPDLPAVRFSEVHYDNVGTDVGEAIEIEGPAGTNLDGWSVVLYNGSGGVSYDVRALTGAIPDHCDGRGVVVVRYEQDGVQNGGQDGFALINASNDVVEFLSYEGVLTATNGPAAGRQSTDIGVAQSSAPHFQTLQRRPSGKWDAQKASTLGGCYGSTPVTPYNQVSFSGRVPFDAPLPVGFEDQLFSTLRAPNDATIQTTFTWESLSPAIASIDEDGVMRALAEGTATFRATAQDGTTGVFSLPMAVATASTTALYGNHAEFGEPTDADPSDDYIARRTEFTSSFNKLRNIPNWVSYNLEATHITPGQDRCDCFTYDPLLPADFARYTTADYTGAGAAAGFGIDRGHLARSFDRTSGSLDNARTFYFSNIIPQAADNNQGPWANFENYLGSLAQNDNREVYIITGGAGSQGTVKNEGLITIPASTWKVAVIMPRDQGLANVDSYDDIEVIAVIMPNVAGIRNVDWRTYVTTVNAVEAVSGYDVLALLPDGVESAVEAGMQDEFALADALVSSGALSSGNGNSLRSKLEAAAASVERGNSVAAVNQLQALLNELDAMVRSRRLTDAEAAPLRAAVAAFVASLGA
ncbi:MAG TPA: DNA/RNA non-specific endonuclease [Gemmatimonadaceae bacterium]|nr:DNA/RNA non-specific endonuclease [Gemmatimonadaceae bacterium]